MTFTEKLERLTEKENKSRISAKAGLPPTAISNYLSKKQIPRADTALAIARALSVPVEWLIDDKQDWPAPQQCSKPSASNLSDDELMAEVTRRYRLAVLDLVARLDEAEKVDWTKLAEQIRSVPSGGSAPPQVVRDSILVYALSANYCSALQKYDPDFNSRIRHIELPGSQRNPDELSPGNLISRWEAVMKKPGFFEVLGMLENTPDARQIRERIQLMSWRELMKAIGRINSASGSEAPKHQ